MRGRPAFALIVPVFAAVFAVAIGAGYLMGQTSFRRTVPAPGLTMPGAPAPASPNSPPAPPTTPPSLARSAVLIDRFLSYYLLILIGAGFLAAYHRLRHAFA